MASLPRSVDWPGFVVEKRGKEWLVAGDDSSISGTALVGAAIVNCDGRGPDEIAKEVIPFHTNPAFRHCWWWMPAGC
jgi:hypothetical protein